MEQAVLVFRGDLPRERIEEAWGATVAATAALGCGLSEEGWIEGLSAPAIHWEKAEPESFEAWLEADRLRGFAEDGGVPWRVSCWPAARRWVWSFPHALLDGRSVARVLRGFLRRLAGGEAEDLPLAGWQPAGEGEKRAAADYFTMAHEGVERAAVDFGESGRGRAGVELGAETAGALEAAARASGTTPATLVTWAWGQALARAAGVEKLALGQVRAGPPVAGRAGFTMNTLPLMVRRMREGPAAEGWRALRQEMLALRAFERLAPEELPAGIFAESGAPWSSVIMVERGTAAHLLGEEGVALLESMELRERSSGPLTASAYLRPDLRLEVETAAGPRAAESLLAHWAAVLRAIVADPAGDAAEITRLPAADETRLVAWEDGGAALDGPDHLAAAWREARARHAADTALWLPEESWTYEELGRRVDAVAGNLGEAGVRAGRTVAVVAGRRWDWPLALLATACLGGIYLPLGPRIPPARLRSMVEDGKPAALLGGSGVEDDFGLPRVCLESDGPHPAPAEREAAGGEVMALIYTSGSTGTPKGVMLDHAGVLNEVRWAARALGLGPGDRMLQFSSPGFDASLEEMLACLLSGATLVPRPEAVADDLAAFQTFIGQAEITVLDLPTAFWSAWAAWLREGGGRVPEKVRATLVGGERASALALADWRAAGGGTLWNSYGPTEASIVATAQEIPPDWNEAGDPPIGRPLPGTHVRVADRRGTAMPPGAAGEIWIGGPAVGPGYWGREDLTAAAFTEREGRRWYRSGDRARWDERGRLHFLGRLDDQLKIRGHRIEPDEVLRRLESFPGVAAAHVGPAGAPDRQVLAAWVRWDGVPPAAWQKRLRDHLAADLPAASVPQRWAEVAEFVLTERGKLDRRALPEPEALRPPQHEEAATPVERRLAGLWDQLLGSGLPGRGDSFFDLGGNSLLALRLFAAISAEFGVTLPMTTLIQSPTLAGLACAIEAAVVPGNSGPAPELVTLREGQDGPPLVCIHGGDGGVFFYLELARALAGGLPVMTLESPALSAAEGVGPVAVEALAADYVAALRRHQPRGPYWLAGYSFGGVMVYEMAVQLRRAGEEVGFLGLFDTENPAMERRKYGMGERAKVYWESLVGKPAWLKAWLLLGRMLGGIRVNLQVRGELLLVRRAGITRPHGKIRALQVREAHAAAMDAYQPPPLDVPLVLFKTAAVDDKFEIPPDYGWGGLAAGLEIVDVPGEHLTMFSPRHVPVLAKEVDARLKRG
jgi:amino acid adenylation domain-containing protein